MNLFLVYRQISLVWIHVSMNNDIVVPMDANEDDVDCVLMECRPDVLRVERVPNDHEDHDDDPSDVVYEDVVT